MKLKYRNSGFTLFELLISLTLLTVILVIVFTSLNLGIRIWEKGEEENEQRRKERIVLNLMKHQIGSLYGGNVDDGSEEKIIFNGTEDYIEFVSTLSVVPGNDFGMVFVRYEVAEAEMEKYTLSVFEKNLIFMTQEMFSDQDSEDFYELLSVSESIGFAYGKRDETGEMNWQETWSFSEEKALPAGVKVGLQKESDDKTPTVIAPIIAEIPEE